MILGGLNSPLANRWIRTILAVGVLIVTLAALVRSWAEACGPARPVHFWIIMAAGFAIYASQAWLRKRTAKT